MSWQPELDELKRRQAFADAMGGADKVKRQHDGGRLTVRERIEGLVDAESFHEVGAVAGLGECSEEMKKTFCLATNGTRGVSKSWSILSSFRIPSL